MDSLQAAEVTATYPELPDQSTDWLMVAKRIADLYQPPPIGRPSAAITDVQRLHKLLTKVADGNYIETAVRSAGFARQTLYNWKEQATAGNLSAIALLDALEKAQADAESDAVTDVRKAGKAGPQYWAASMTRLERRHPDRWGKRPEDSGTPKVLVQIGVSSGDVKVAIAEAKVPLLTE